MELCFDSNNINLFIPLIWYYLKQSMMLIPLCGVCVYFQTVRLPNPTWTLAGKQRVTSRKSPAKCQSAPSQGTEI